MIDKKEFNNRMRGVLRDIENEIGNEKGIDNYHQNKTTLDTIENMDGITGCERVKRYFNAIPILCLCILINLF